VNRRIVLIGFSATGKSTVGRIVAQRLGWGFVDTDQVIIEQAGKSIGEIFHGEGEDAFRSYERKALLAAARRQPVVIASGGGAVLVEKNRVTMSRTCYIVCLEARPETIHQRLLLDAQAGVNPIAELLTKRAHAVENIAYLKQFRQPYYAIANWTVHTDNLTPQEAAEEVLHGWTFHERANVTGANHGVDELHYPIGDARESDAPYSP
jgi:shikimate kinase